MVTSCGATIAAGRSSGCSRGFRIFVGLRCASTSMTRTTSASFTWAASGFCSDAIYETASRKVGDIVSDLLADFDVNKGNLSPEQVDKYNRRWMKAYGELAML